MSNVIKTLFSTIAVTALFHTPLASAAEQITVQTSAAELSTAEGAQQVYNRINAAAKMDCDSQFVSPYAVKSKTRYNRCIRGTVNYMVSKLAHPKLDKVYAEAQSHQSSKNERILIAARK